MIYIEDAGSDSKLAIIIGASTAGGVVIISLLAIVCIICCFSRRAKAKEKQFTNLLAQMELWEVEMADECKRGKPVASLASHTMLTELLVCMYMYLWLCICTCL